MNIADLSEAVLAPMVAGMPIFAGADPDVMLDGGNAASNEEVFHDSLNLASIWNLPVVHVCETNRWARGSSAAVHSPWRTSRAGVGRGLQ